MLTRRMARTGRSTCRRIGWSSYPIIIQTPSGGYHAFFRADGAGTHQLTLKGEGVGLDWRGDGGYVVVFPGYKVIKGAWPCDPQTQPTMPPEFRYEALNREEPTAEEEVATSA